MKKYIAKCEIIREVNPHNEKDGMWPIVTDNPAHQIFENSVQSYATDLPDGEYLEDEISNPAYRICINNRWLNADGSSKYRNHRNKQLFVTAKPKEESAPYDQKFFNHMNEEHGLTLVQSEMHEIGEVVKETYDLIGRKVVIEAIEEYRFENTPPDRMREDFLTIIKNIK